MAEGEVSRIPRKYSAHETVQIYTDWANHYLDKARCKRRIQDLQADVTDGVLLADLIEAVTNQKVPDINRKPKSSSQMIENISWCLSFLNGLGVSVDGLHAKDIRDGNLKAILGLFFALSRHKQYQKQQQLQYAEREKMRQQHQQIQQHQYQHAVTHGDMSK